MELDAFEWFWLASLAFGTFSRGPRVGFTPSASLLRQAIHFDDSKRLQRALLDAPRAPGTGKCARKSPRNRSWKLNMRSFHEKIGPKARETHEFQLNFIKNFDDIFDDFQALSGTFASVFEAERFVWQLAVQVGSQSISPLFWALRTNPKTVTSSPNLAICVDISGEDRWKSHENRWRVHRKDIKRP